MSPGEDEAACANDLSIAMSVIGLREHYETYQHRNALECRSSMGVVRRRASRAWLHFYSQFEKVMGEYLRRELLAESIHASTRRAGFRFIPSGEKYFLVW